MESVSLYSLFFSPCKCPRLQLILLVCFSESPSSCSVAANLVGCLVDAIGIALVEKLLRNHRQKMNGYTLSSWIAWIWGSGWWRVPLKLPSKRAHGQRRWNRKRSASTLGSVPSGLSTRYENNPQRLQFVLVLSLH